MEPYTYYLSWSKIDKHYYGVKYGKDANPNTLWVNYFTSSAYVKQLREEYGEPDIVQVRKTFSNAESAINWESKFLKRVKAIYNESWLNKYDGKSILMDEETKRKISESKKGITTREGYTLSDDHKKKIGKANKGKSRKMSEETKRKISEAMKGKNTSPKSKEHKEKISKSQKGVSRPGRPRKI